jgi:hypothetical protein
LTSGGTALSEPPRIVSSKEIVWNIKADESATGDFTLQQAWDTLTSSPVNNTNYYLFLSAGRHVATQHFVFQFSSFMNISIYYGTNKSAQQAVLAAPFPTLWMNYSRIQHVSFSNVVIENSSVGVSLCSYFSLGDVSLVGM